VTIALVEVVIVLPLLGIVAAWWELRRHGPTRRAVWGLQFTAIAYAVVSWGLGIWIIRPTARTAGPSMTVLGSVATGCLLAGLVVGLDAALQYRETRRTYTHDTH